jgi:alcohol dehydrogenase class IV
MQEFAESSNFVLLSFVMNVNVPSCIERSAEIGRALGLADNDSAEMLARPTIVAFRKLSSHCVIPSSLQELKIPESVIPGMAG